MKREHWILLFGVLIFSSWFLSRTMIPVAAASTNKPDQTALSVATLTADTFIAEGRPNEDRQDFRTVWVGYDTTGGFRSQYSLLAFDLPDLPTGAQITSANLRLFMSGWTKNDESLRVTVYPLASGWEDERVLNWQVWEADYKDTVDKTIATETQIGIDTEEWYEWNVLAHVNAVQNNEVSLILISDRTSGQHERAFWSKDCAASDCGTDKYPQLIIEYELPSEPGLTLSLSNSPAVGTEPGERIEYTVHYANNGAAILTDVRFVATVPSNARVEYADGSQSANPAATLEPPDAEGKIRWRFDELSKDASGTLTYAVDVADASPLKASQTENGITLSKEARQWVFSGSEIEYVLEVVSAEKRERTFVLWDEIPEGTSVVPGSISGGGKFSDGKVEWTLPSLEKQVAYERSFRVQTRASDAGSEIVNKQYGLRRQGDDEAFNAVDPLKTMLVEAIVHEPVTAYWKAGEKDGSEQSNGVINSPNNSYLPIISTAKAAP